MAAKAKSSKTDSNASSGAPMNEMAETARKNYEEAMRTGERFREEAGQWWTRLWTQAANGQEWQRQLAAWSQMAGRMMPVAQEQFQDVMNLVEKNGRTGAELVKKAVEAAQAPAPSEQQAKWLELWTSSMKAVQSNVEAVSDISTRAIDSWVDFVRRNTETMEVRVPKVA